MDKLLIYLTLTVSLAAGVLPGSEAPPHPPAAPSEPGAGGQVDPAQEGAEEPPEGYYAFVESPNATPPRVRPPPYRQSSAECAGAAGTAPHVSAHNLCGDLNRGLIPRNPMKQAPNGDPYPFELIRNQTLKFLSRTLPVLRADDTLPRVAMLARPPQPGHAGPDHPPPGYDDLHGNRLEERNRRSLESDPSVESLRAEHRAATEDLPDAPAPRESRKFCDGGGVFCMLYRAINGDGSPAAGVERREDPGSPAPAPAPLSPHRYEGPPTPCPARVEYATPVFARNYQGVWRYVVQIPYEGYFTQTVEVTRCMQSRCHYLEGGCLSSPRWVSLLVAELHYPQEYQQAGYGAASTPGAGAEDGSGTDKPNTHCDGHDELGCFQVRLYYDWFLVPGSCKCWRPDYFARYVRRRHSTNEL